MLVGCYLAGFKSNRYALRQLGFMSSSEVYLHASKVLGVEKSSVKNWMDEFLPYWANSKRASIQPDWEPSVTKGRPRNDKKRPTRVMMFNQFEFLPEPDFTCLVKVILGLVQDVRYDPAYLENLVEPYLDFTGHSIVFSATEVARRVSSNVLPEVITPPMGALRPQRRKEGDGSYVYARSLDVVSWALRRARGICELCECAGPFIGASGHPFLEVHHVIPLSDGGPDVVQNVAALCPNCHRACHLAPDRLLLASQLKARLLS